MGFDVMRYYEVTTHIRSVRTHRTYLAWQGPERLWLLGAEATFLHC